jgi:death-on-curing protein
MITLTKEQVIMLHERIFDRYGGSCGVLNEGMLDSAIEAPFQTFDGEELFPENLDKIVRMAYGLIKNHSFRDGNKRIGALVLLTLLELNGYHVSETNAEFTDIIMGVAASEKNEEDIMEWVKMHATSDNS